MPEEPQASFEFRKPDLQMLLQDQATLTRMHTEERRQHEKQIREERELSRWREERTRAELTEKLHDLEHQNAALVRTLGHLQGEVDRLREELAIEKGKHFTEPMDLKDAKSPMAAVGMLWRIRTPWLGVCLRQFPRVLYPRYPRR
jgi:hypothetical protein